MNDIYYLHTDRDIKKLITFINDVQGQETKYKDFGKQIVEGQTGKIIRKYISLIGIDNIVVAVNNIMAKNKNITNKALENEFKEFIERWRSD
jgi:hypothetical protein